jgi:nickel-type superoxide dismutase maturation protease
VLGLVAVCVVWWRRAQPVTRVTVAGVSMVPELAPGDRLVVVRWPALEPGDVVALRDPGEPGRILVKRVSRLHAATIEVRGDNTGASRDSREIGAISRGDVIGRVVYRYHPPGRAGTIARPGRYDVPRR